MNTMSTVESVPNTEEGAVLPLPVLTPESIRESAFAMEEWLVSIRRNLHRIPEPGYEEHKTQAFILDVLKELDVEYRVEGTATIGIICGRMPGKVVALRADIDALPIIEEGNKEYASTNAGYMHACGHDAHTTVLLGVARYFSMHRDDFDGAIKLFFQPAEETDGGALPMIKAGCLENPRVDSVIGLHVMPYLPAGTVEVKYGALNGASDTLGITIHGTGAHGASPDLGIDAVMIAGHLIVALHSLVSRYVSPLEPAVLTIGAISGGIRSNIIADTVTMKATLRTTSPEVEEKLLALVGKLVESLPGAFGGSGELTIEPSYRSLINHDQAVDAVIATAKEILGEDNIRMKEKPSMGVEDFSYFLLERPGAFYHLGCGDPARGIDAPLHSGRFDIDEKCLPYGVAMQAALALRLLN